MEVFTRSLALSILLGIAINSHKNALVLSTIVKVLITTAVRNFQGSKEYPNNKLLRHNTI